MRKIRVTLTRTERITVDVECDYAKIKPIELKRLAEHMADFEQSVSERSYSIVSILPMDLTEIEFNEGEKVP